MNWLLCCGDEKSRTKDKQNTVDLSKPLMPEQLKLQAQEDIDGLSGKQSAQS
jgi:hypothetical protein